MDKFKNTEQLEKAYKELEKEFTKKSQKVKALESEAKITYVYGGDLKEHIKVIEAKEHQIELLNKRWEMLKEYINGFKEYNIEEANMAWILTDKMQELEQEFCEKVQ